MENLKDTTKEQLLKESEEKYRGLYNSIRDSILVADTNRNIIDCNPAFYELFGYSKDEIIGKQTVYVYENESEFKELGEALKAHFGDKPFLKTVNYKKKSGEIFPGETNVFYLKDDNGVVNGFIGLIRDITDRKQAESKLRESEEKYKAMYEETPLSYQSLDINGNFLDINPKWLSTLGYTKEEVIGKWFGDFLHPDYVEHFRINFPEFKKRGYVTDVQFNMRKKNGEFIYISFEGCIGYTPAGEFKQTYCVFKDITKEYEFEKQLKESEEKFRSIFEFSPLGKSLTHIDGRLEINKTFSDILGYTINELKTKNWNDITHPDDIQKSEDAMQSLLNGKVKMANFEKRYIHKNGSIVWVEIITILKRDKDNNPEYFQTTIQDITLKKESTRKLRQSEERYRLLFNLLPYGGEVLDTHGNIVNCSSSTGKMLGYKVSELIGKPISTFLAPESIIIFKKIFPLLLKGEPANAEIQMIRKDGSILNILRAAQPILDEQGQVKSILALNLDITERKQTEEKLKNSEEKFRKAFITSPDSININRLKDGLYVDVNNGFSKIMGYTEDEIIGKTSVETNIWTDLSDRNKLVAGLQANGFVENLEAKFRAKGGEIKDGLMSATAIELNGEPHILSIVRDITERKQAEKKLNEVHRRLDDSIENMSDAFVFLDRNWCYTIMNKKAGEIFGRNPVDMIGKHIWTEFPEGIGQPFQLNYEKAMNEKVFIRMEEYYPPYDKWFENRINPTDDGIAIFFTDITERKKTEEKIWKLSTAVEQSPSVIVITDTNGIIEYANPKFTELTGYSNIELVGQNPRILKSGEQPGAFYKEFWKTISAGNEWHGEFHNKKKNGEFFWEAASVSPIFDAQGKITNYLKVAEDITEHKQNQEALRISEEQNRAITQTAADAIISINEDGIILSWNKAAEKIFGYSSAEKINTKLSEIIPSRYKAGHDTAMERIKNKGNKKLIGKTVQLTATRKDGVEIPIEFSLSSWEANNQKNYTGIIRDITERKRAEQIQKVLYNISQAALTSKNTEDLISIIQKQLGTIIDTKNFYIAFYDAKTDTFTSPFVSDEKDKLETWPAGKTYSAYVVKKGKSLLVTKEYLKKLKAAGEIVNVGVASEVWLGVPLITEGLAKGVLAVQSYTDENAYTKQDVEILEFVASQIATSLERKNAEQNLIESEERFKMLSTLTFEGIVLHDNGIVTDVNLSFAKMFGYEYEELIGSNVIKLLAVKKDYEIIVQNIKKSHSLPYEIEGIKKDGSHFPLEIEGRDVFIKAENKTLRVAAVRDITERKKAEQIQKVLYNISNAGIETDNLEELLAQIQIELGKIIDSTNFHVAFYDEETDLISLPFFLNNEVNIPEVVTGKTLTRYLIKQKKSLLINKEKLLKLRKSNEIRDFEVDPEIWLGVPLKNGGKLTGVLIVQSYTDQNAYNESDLRILEFVSDQVGISIHRKKTELDIVQALQKATESDRLKSAFLATISHELRTPLNAIIGFSEFFDENLPIDDMVNFGKIINSSGQHLLSIVNDLFDITLIEAGETKLKNEETSLKTIFYDVHAVIEGKMQRDNKKSVELKLIFSEEDEDFSFNADVNKIKQILINLLKNAIKFTHNGYIHYGCELVNEKNSAFLKFYVKDTGIGISKEKQNLIFEIFRQADDTYTRKYGGTGIGLSVAKRFAEVLGGKIWLESEVGVGSTFYFTIPVEKPESVSLPILEEKEAIEISGNKTKTILIVEDDLMSFKFFEVVLHNLGYKYILAQDGEEAIRMCKENKDIDLVLMDINMPVLNGYEATKAIKQFLPNLPIIAQTAFATAGDREKSLAAGCDDYITKPINKDELIKMIGKYLNK